MGIDSVIGNFIGGFALGVLGLGPVRIGCCCGGFGGGYNQVDFETFANGFPVVFPPNLSGGFAPEQISTEFVNPYPTLDFSGVAKSIYNYATNPNSPHNKMIAEMMKQQNSAASYLSAPAKVKSVDYPFSPFYFPSQYTYYPFYSSNLTSVKPDSKSEEKSSKKTEDSTSTSDITGDKRFSKMLDFVLSQEGGYSNNKHDKGGETNKGITTATYDEYRTKKGLSKQSVKKITDSEVQEIYYEMYYKASGADKISDKQLALYVFDTAVNMGVSTAKDILSQSGNDLNTFEQIRREKYNNIVKKDSSQKQFLNTWLGRINAMSNFAKDELNYIA